MKKVFISYSSRDRASAFQMRTVLEAHDCEVWLDYFDLHPADRLEEELTGNIRKADVVCLLLSPSSVDSQWVRQEIECARGEADRGLVLLPVILRPCEIPKELENTVGLDASHGFEDQAIQLRLVRAVRGESAIEDQVILDAAQISQLAREKERLEAEWAFPAVAKELARVANEPVRRIDITVDPESLPRERKVVYELVLNTQSIWTVPMSFYFATYREGATWPEGFELPERPYTHYFGKNRPRIDAKLQWFDRLVDLGQTVDGTDLKDGPAHFYLEMDGEEFTPTTPGVHLPQRFEIPPLQKLRDDEATIQLIAHDAETKTAQYVDPGTTDVDIRVRATFDDAEPQWVTLYRSAHDAFERNVLASDFLSKVESRIEQEALLNLYPPVTARPRALRDATRARVHELAQAQIAPAGDAQPEEIRSDGDRRLVARYLDGEARLAVVRGQHDAALSRFFRIAKLLEPLVFDRLPLFDDATLLYRACGELASYFSWRNDPERARPYVDFQRKTVRRLLSVQPDEPDYHRLHADALLKSARIHAESGDFDRAADELAENVACWRRLHAELPNASRAEDRRRAMAEGLDLARQWNREGSLPVEEWREALGLDADHDADGDDDGDAAQPRAAGAVPAWLEPAEPDGWPTRLIESSMLRYRLRIPQGWSDQPDSTAVPVGPNRTQVTHIYRGPQPTEWLIVDAMDNADTESDMKTWVEAILAMVGFPVLQMSQAIDPDPQLIAWSYEGAPDELAQRLHADQVHLYRGMAKLDVGHPRLSHIYLLMVRRGTFAWKVTFCLESACLPGMDEDLVAGNDHVRAGATFGALELL